MSPPPRRHFVVHSLVQSPTSSLDFVEEIPNPSHVHVLEVVNEEEDRRVEVAPYIGRFLLDHQVRNRTAFSDEHCVSHGKIAIGGEIRSYIVCCFYSAKALPRIPPREVEHRWGWTYKSTW